MVLDCYSEGDIVGNGTSCVEAAISVIYLYGYYRLPRGDFVSFNPFAVDCGSSASAI